MPLDIWFSRNKLTDDFKKLAMMVARWDWWDQALRYIPTHRSLGLHPTTGGSHAAGSSPDIDDGTSANESGTADSNKTRTDKTCVFFSFLSAKRNNSRHNFPSKTDVHGMSMSQNRSPQPVKWPQRNLRECVPRQCTNFRNALSQDHPPIFDETVDL